MKRFEGKVAIVTGAGGDIGRTTCLRLLSEGANVVGTDLSAKVLEKTILAVNEAGYEKSRFIAVPGNVCSREDQIAVADYTVKQFGRIDILVACAGILRHFPVDVMTEKQWQDVIDINLTGVYHSIVGVVPYMKQQKYGRIVMISSIGGRTGRPGVGINYAAAKAGLVGIGMCLAHELAPWSITVNCVAPGPLKGGMFLSMAPEAQEKLTVSIPLGRAGELEEIAGCVAYVASDEAAWITGHCLDINGGAKY